MEFEELPIEVQKIAAQALADRFSPSGMAPPTSNTEPANKLAREIREAFVQLYSQDEVISNWKATLNTLNIPQGRDGSNVGV